MPGETRSATKAYKVLAIDEMVRPAKTGGIEKFYRHTILTKGEIRLTVDIDEEDFTPDKADPILTKEAQNADKIKAL